MRRSGVLFAFAMCLVCTATASAQQWADKMFAERSHDFGQVPRAAKVEFPFVITNLYAADIHIAAVRASCGCTQPRIEKDTLKPNEKGAIVAAFNTRAFTGQHGARVTVTIDRPQWAEVVLDVKGYIRTDIVLDPGQVNLGSVPTGQTVEKIIRIDHAGRNDWKITDVASNSPYLTASTKEISRTRDRVSYELDVQLKEGAPIGYLKDQLQLSTNDQRAKQFPVIVEGLIVSDLTVSPAALMLGNVQPGQTITKQIVVKGLKPFKIVDIHCDNPAFTFQPSADAKSVHLVPVTFQAGREVGKIAGNIEIVTDLGENKTAQLTVLGQVSEPLAGR
jgi:hypothetical protein